MGTQRWIMVAAVVCAVAAAWVTYRAVERRGLEATRSWEPVSVLVAKSDLDEGTTLTKENVGVGALPKSSVTRSVVTAADVRDGTPVFGRRLALSMRAGDTLLYQHIASGVGVGRLAEAVQPKGRAVAIRVNPESSVHYWVQPADHVDVLGVFRDSKSHQLVSMTLLQNVVVLATGRVAGQTMAASGGGAAARSGADEGQGMYGMGASGDGGYSTVTLQVLPEAAEMLVLAQDLGSLYLSLRHPEDNAIAELADGKTTMATLLTGERSKRISRTQSKLFRVEVIRGQRKEFQAVR